MAISYANTGFGFVDSQFGTAANATGIKTLVNQVVDKRYHKQVQKKIIFQKLGLIGSDAYDDGTVSNTSPGMPIIRKTDLQSQSGDVIKMGLRHTFTVAHTSGGKVGDAQLVDNESALDFSSCKVSIERVRFALRGNGGMNEQRNSYEPQADMFNDSLADGAAQLYDTSLLYAANCGFAPHLFRQHGITNCPPTEPTYTLIGNDLTLNTARTIADLRGGTDDSLKAQTFEIGATMCSQSDLNPVTVEGYPFWFVLISPKAELCLLQDSKMIAAMQLALQRGEDNPIFKHARFIYNNCIIYTYDKIRTILGGNNPAGLTVSGNAITEAAYTGIGGGNASTDLHQTLFFGANAVALAEGKMQTSLIRAENDYGNIIGRATDLIFGARRVKYTKEDTTTNTEQGMVKIINTTNV